jgi:hypothetical protein
MYQNTETKPLMQIIGSRAHLQRESGAPGGNERGIGAAQRRPGAPRLKLRAAGRSQHGRRLKRGGGSLGRQADACAGAAGQRPGLVGASVCAAEDVPPAAAMHGSLVASCGRACKHECQGVTSMCSTVYM